MRVLLIEPDNANKTIVELLLKKQGYNVYSTDDPEEGIDLAKTYDYNVIISELDFPGLKPLDVIRQIRRSGIKTPIIAFPAEYSVDTEVLALGAGADALVTKPFHLDILLARIQSVVRRSNGHADSLITFGNIAIDLNAKQCLVDNQPVHLTGKEYQMLELLMLRQGTTITKEMFLNQLYGGMDEPDIKIIDVFICKLRKKLAAVNAGVHSISTTWGRVYKMDKTAMPNRPSSPAPEYNSTKQAEETLRLREQLIAIRSEMGLGEDASISEVMSAIKAQKAAQERLLDDDGDKDNLRENDGLSANVPALNGAFRDRVNRAPPSFDENGLRQPIGSVFKIGSLIEVDTLSMQAANIQTETVVDIKPVVGTILEILSYYQGKSLNKQGLLDYLFQEVKPANETKLGMFMTQAQGALTQLVGRELATSFIQVLSGGGYGMPDTSRMLGYNGAGAEAARVISHRQP